MDNNKLLVLRQDNVISKIFGFVKSLFIKIDGKMNDVMEDKKAKEEDVVLADTMFKMDEPEEQKDISNVENIEQQNNDEIAKKDFKKKYIKLYFQVRNGKTYIEELSFSDLFMVNALYNSEIKHLKEKIDF